MPFKIAALTVASLLAVAAQAGDILRGGATSSSSRANAQARANAGSEAAAAAQTRAQDRLARTTKAINDMRQLQAAARAAAGDGGVPDGLVINGLNRYQPGETNFRWEGASAPVANGNNITITQSQQQAILHWKTFNVGKNTQLTFDQSGGGADSGKWIAFNKVFDPGARPSQIRGQIKADGQVYILNQNGIIFGAGSQVNARTLVASSLPINDNLVTLGLLNNRDAQFLFSTTRVPGGSDGTDPFVPSAPPGGTTGNVIVERGASISTPAGTSGNGGRIMLVGPQVINEGTLSTPQGQTVLAAGLQVGVQAHAQDDPSLRGLDVWIGSVGTDAGKVVNNGLIESPKGSILIAGKDIEQNGVLNASTSVALNGRIDLIASYGAVANPNFDNSGAVGSGLPIFISQFTGTVKLGEKSVTQVTPEYEDQSTVPGTKLPEISQINIAGLAVYVGKDSFVTATSGNLTTDVGTWTYTDAANNGTIFDGSGTVEPGLSTNFLNGAQRMLHNSGQFYIDSGAIIDVSGTPNALVPLSQNITTVQLRGNELADSTVQRTSVVRGKSLVVDLRKTGSYGGRDWVGTPLGDLTGVANVVQRDVAQLTTAGGNVTIQAGGSIVVQNGSTIDVSGGFLHNAGGSIKTTRLRRGATLVDIAKATPDVIYDGIYDDKTTRVSTKWNVSRTFKNALSPTGGFTQAAYDEGAAGGSISLAAPTVVLAGKLLGHTVTGPRQLDAPPTLASLKLSFRGQDRIARSPSDIRFIETSNTPPAIEFATVAPTTYAAPYTEVNSVPVPVTGPNATNLVLGADLYRSNGSGFGNVQVDNPDGDFLIPAGVNVRIPAGGSLVVSTANARIAGSISAPGGTVSVTAYNFSPFLYQFLTETDALLNKAAPAPVAARGTITLLENSFIDVSGMLIDERPNAADGYAERRTINAGSVTLEGYNVTLGSGSRILASAGARMKSNGSLSYGKAGSISLLAGKDPSLSTTIGGRLTLDGRLEAFASEKAPANGGSLTLQSSIVQIGGAATSPDVLLLDPSFFQEGGFTSYTLRGIGKNERDGSNTPAIAIAPGTAINPVEKTLARIPGSTLAFKPVLRQEGDRSPVSMKFVGIGSDDPFTDGVVEALGLVIFGEGSSIATDAGASVSVSGDAIALLGSIQAPGGNVTIAGRSEFRLTAGLREAATFALPTVYIGSTARIDVSGKTVLQSDPYGRRKGNVYGGGNIYATGNIIAERGAVLDASGASGILDLDPTSVASGTGVSTRPRVTTGLTERPWSRRSVATRVDTSGGLIDLEGSQMLYSDATVRAFAGGPSATGGTLAVSSGRFYSFGASRTSADINMIVTQSGDARTFGAHPFAADVPQFFIRPQANLQSRFTAGTSNEGIGYFSASQFTEGGFASLELGYKYYPSAEPVPYGGNLEFRGPVAIAAPGSIKLAAGGVIRADSPVTLTAPYIAIGQKFTAPLNPSDAFSAYTQFPVPNEGRAYYPRPTFGNGTLSVNAQLIDVGTLSLQTIGRASLSAPNGDIRGSGTFSMVGDLTIEAGQVYPTTLASFTLVAYDPPAGRSTVTILPSGPRPTPLSAGGTLSIFASNIIQRGVLRAPLGSIVIGWDGTDFDPSDAAFSQPTDIVGGPTMTIPTSQNVNLAAGSTTSVSAIDAITGKELLIPFGLSADGLSWIDPRGVNVSITGLPRKSVTIGGLNVSADEGSTIDVRGGGDLIAFRWKRGTGGSVDLLNSSKGDWTAASNYTAGDLVSYGGKTWSARVTINPDDFDSNSVPRPGSGRYWSQIAESYAVLPDFTSSVAPYNTFNTGSNSGDLNGNTGYTSASLKVGDKIFLEGVPGLAAGSYTLLPRLYAVLPGAFLVTPSENLANPQAKMAGITVADRSTYTSGYRFNEFNQMSAAPGIRKLYEVAPQSTVEARATYEVLKSSEFTTAAAERFNAVEVQDRPVDAGSVVFRGNVSLRADGTILGSPVRDGRGATVDLASYSDMAIVGDGIPAPTGAAAVLNSSKISGWGVESVLVGGVRRKTTEGTIIEVRTRNITVANAGSTLASPEVVLTSRERLSVAAGSSIASSGSGSRPSNFMISGDGTALGVSANPDFSITRSNITGSTAPRLAIGANSRLSGPSVLVDSTYSSPLDPSTLISATNLTLNSGQISILLQPQGTVLAGSVVPEHLVLTGGLLGQVQTASSLTLTSYRTIDVYGTGGFGSSSIKQLKFRAGGDNVATVPQEFSIRGFNQGGGVAAFAADSITFENPNVSVGLAAPAGPLSGTIVFQSDTTRLGYNDFGIAGYQNATLNAISGLLALGTGRFSTAGDLNIATSLITGATGSVETLSAGGQFNMQNTGATAKVSGGLGGNLSFLGTSIIANSRVYLPSGLASFSATTGGITVGGQIDVSGTAQAFYDVVRYSGAGSVLISAPAGQVRLLGGSLISVSGSGAGGNAGTVSIASQGAFLSEGTLVGRAAAGSTSGTFLLDAGSLPSYSALASRLDAGEFGEERNLRIRTGNVTVDGTTNARKFSLSTDAGSITVAGVINAAGETGGEINLAARENVTLLPGSLLSVAGRRFNAAGKGGSIRIEAGSQSGGTISPTALLDIRAGSRLDLSVASFVPGDYTTVGSSAFYGQFPGTLHLRAPQRTVGANLGVGISQLLGDIAGASSILVEGYQIFTVTGATGQITGSRTNFSGIPSATLAAGTTQRNIYNNGVAFVGANGVAAAGYNTMVNSLLGAGDPKGLSSRLVVVPGAELINTTANGDITLGTASSNWAFDWNLADFRFGPKSAPGVLTIRAPGNVVFFNTLSDGFSAVSNTASGSGNSSMWLAPLMAINPALPTNTQSWSFRIVAGADLTAADATRVLATSALGSTKGSIRLGKSITTPSGSTTSTSTLIGTTSLSNYQVIRTGTGNIQIAAARDVRLLNHFASIYTAGARIANPNNIFAAGDFVTPLVTQPASEHPSQTSQLGAPQQIYAPQWSMAGGNISINANGSIGRYRVSGSTDILDSSKQLPSNWLYRRGLTDSNGLFAVGGVDSPPVATVTDPSASTTWWIDFSNFFEGVGALGGGNVALTAGADILNIDAFAPTNARMSGLSGTTRLAPSATRMLELGGGDVTVTAGRNIDGGVYYVERGTGRLFAGGSIVTNSTRSPRAGGDALTWLPTTLFLGKGSFDVSARQNVLLGPVVNAFWTPQGVQNKFWYKTYFSTYSPDSSVNVTSLGGSITHRLNVVDSGSVTATTALTSTQPVLIFWLNNQNLFRSVNPSNSQPWIRLAEGDTTSLTGFSSVSNILPPTLRSTAFTKDINIAGTLNLFPAATGGLELLAAGEISGLQVVGRNAAGTLSAYSSARVNVSDANPSVLPGYLAPFGIQSVAGRSQIALRSTPNGLLASKVDVYFQESGSYTGNDAGIDRKRSRHTAGLLHATDPNPVRIYAGKGDIYSLTLFSPKQTRILAEQDITDIALYLQHNRLSDISIVAAGRDIIPYNDSARVRAVATSLARGNILIDPNQATTSGKTTKALAGDIQLGGLGTLEVLAGRNVDLGTGDNLTDGRGSGITTIGKSRNPFLPFDGASVIVMAGVSGKSGSAPIGLAGSNLNFESLLSKASYSEAEAISALPDFFDILVQAGEEHATTGSYDLGFAAIDDLFGATSKAAQVFTRARDIRTTSGGAITIAAPNGGLTLASAITGNPLTPPGIVTEYGGAVSIVTDGDVDIGQARIFTLRGGDMTIWSSNGDIAAGSAAKTVVTAPPTRVLIDTTSADIQTDLGGLATGGGIGVLASVEGVEPGNVTLIAPNGTVDAGDAGIRATGNITIAAVAVLNAENISAGGSTTGVPTAPTVAAPNIGGLTSGSSSTAAASNAADQVSNQAKQGPKDTVDTPSIITVEVLGYGGDEE